MKSVYWLVFTDYADWDCYVFLEGLFLAKNAKRTNLASLIYAILDIAAVVRVHP